MAIEVKNIAIGAGVLSIGDWVTAGGAGSLTDVGLLKDGSEITIEEENYEIESDSVQGALLSVPVKTTVKVKAVMQEATLALLRRMIQQPTGNLTGTAPNDTLLVGDRTEQYSQMTISTKGGKGAGSVAATRLFTFWKGVPKLGGAIAIKKGAEQTWEVEFSIMYDPSLATADKFFKIANSGAA